MKFWKRISLPALCKALNMVSLKLIQLEVDEAELRTSPSARWAEKVAVWTMPLQSLFVFFPFFFTFHSPFFPSPFPLLFSLFLFSSSFFPFLFPLSLSPLFPSLFPPLFQYSEYFSTPQPEFLPVHYLFSNPAQRGRGNPWNCSIPRALCARTLWFRNKKNQSLIEWRHNGAVLQAGRVLLFHRLWLGYDGNPSDMEGQRDCSTFTLPPPPPPHALAQEGSAPAWW